VNLAEDAAFLRECVKRGMRLARVANNGAYVYMRHGANTWAFAEGEFLAESGWERSSPPPGLSESVAQRYREAALAAGR
jgi:hypothetical protein